MNILNVTGRVGFGIDLMTVAELKNLLDRTTWFQKYFFNPRELHLCESFPEDRRLEFLAGRFSAKESLQKALFSLMRRRIAIRPCNIMILRDNDRRPIVKWYLEELDTKNYDIALSISHKQGICVSAALLYRKIT